MIFLKKNDTLRNEINALSIKCLTLEKEKDVYINDNRTLSYENINLKKEIEKLKPIVDKLTLSSNKLELLLTNKRDSDNKTKIGYNSKITNGISTTKFVSSKTFTSTFKTKRYKPNLANYKHVKTIISTSTPHAFTSQTIRNTFNQMSKTLYYSFKRNTYNVFQSNSSISYSPSIKSTKREWLQKELKVTNPKGPKVAWVPKSVS